MSLASQISDLATRIGVEIKSIRSSLLTLGTTGTTAAAGNDARLSDARTPTAHAASHAEGGDDELSEISMSSVSGLVAYLISTAPLNSPALTGGPTAPTAAPGANTTQIATTAFAAAAVAATSARTTFSNTTYTVQATDRRVAQTGTMSASRVVTLPAASAVAAGTSIVIIDESGTVTATNSLVITRAGSDTIDGATTETIQSAYGARTLFSNGSNKWTHDGGVIRGDGTVTKVVSLSQAAYNALTPPVATTLYVIV